MCKIFQNYKSYLEGKSYCSLGTRKNSLIYWTEIKSSNLACIHKVFPALNNSRSLLINDKMPRTSFWRDRKADTNTLFFLDFVLSHAREYASCNNEGQATLSYFTCRPSSCPLNLSCHLPGYREELYGGQRIRSMIRSGDQECEA